MLFIDLTYDKYPVLIKFDRNRFPTFVYHSLIKTFKFRYNKILRKFNSDKIEVDVNKD